MPTGLEINPAFGTNLQACPTASINAGGDTCPAQSQVGTASLKTPLLDPANSYTGKVFLETPGTTAATRFKLAMIVELPGADLIVRGQVLLDGSSDLSNGVGSKDTGTGQITASFNNIPDLGFTELEMVFNGATPMLVNPKTCSLEHLHRDDHAELRRNPRRSDVGLLDDPGRLQHAVLRGQHHVQRERRRHHRRRAPEPLADLQPQQRQRGVAEGLRHRAAGRPRRLDDRHRPLLAGQRRAGHLHGRRTGR